MMSVHVSHDSRVPFGFAHLRRAAIGLVAMLTAIYASLFVLVKNAEAGLSENTYGAYLFLAVGYLLLTLLVAFRDDGITYLAGALVQVAVLTLFVLFGVGVFGPGVFDYEAVSSLHMAWWAGVTAGLELVLIALFTVLGRTRRIL